MENRTLYGIVIASMVVLSLAGVVFIFIVQSTNNSLNEGLDRERLKSEALLAEKLAIQKELDRNKDLGAEMEDQNSKLQELIDHKTEVLTTQTLENKRIKKELSFFKERFENESGLTRELNKNLDSAKISYATLNSLNNNLTDSLDFYQSENAYLKQELHNEMIASIDQTLISGLKRNGHKVTSKARATKKLIANVEVPGNLHDLRFEIESPDGVVLTDGGGSIAATVLEDDRTLTASTDNKSIYPNIQSQQVQVIYTPDQRLKPGTYVFKIFNQDHYVGSMKVKLR